VGPYYYGPYASFAPPMDSFGATCSAAESDLLAMTYGDLKGTAYVESIKAFTAGMDACVQEHVDRCVRLARRTGHDTSGSASLSSGGRTPAAGRCRLLNILSSGGHAPYEAVSELAAKGTDITKADPQDVAAEVHTQVKVVRAVAGGGPCSLRRRRHSLDSAAAAATACTLAPQPSEPVLTLETKGPRDLFKDLEELLKREQERTALAAGGVGVARTGLTLPVGDPGRCARAPVGQPLAHTDPRTLFAALVELGVDPSFMQAVVYQDPRTVVDGIEYVGAACKLRGAVLAPGPNERRRAAASATRAVANPVGSCRRRRSWTTTRACSPTCRRCSASGSTASTWTR